MNEEQNWENWQGYDDVEVDAQSREPMTILIDQREGNVEYVETETEQQPIRVDQSGEATEIGSEQPFLDLTIPQADQSLENIPEVQILNSPQNIFVGYKLPFRHNHGKPPNRYSPDHETSKSKYPIANHISTQKLFEP